MDLKDMKTVKVVKLPRGYFLEGAIYKNIYFGLTNCFK